MTYKLITICFSNLLYIKIDMRLSLVIINAYIQHFALKRGIVSMKYHTQSHIVLCCARTKFFLSESVPK